MKRFIFLIITCFSVFHVSAAVFGEAKWISTMECQNSTNTWLAYRKKITLSQKPPGEVMANIAVDSKYWLWINGEMVVFEGGLKRGPNPEDTYFDKVDISKYLVQGENTIAVLLWYFGKDGFAHKSSGKAGLLFNCHFPEFTLISDSSWKCARLYACGDPGEPYPNFRLAEPNILFDARRCIGNWHEPDFDDSRMDSAMELAIAGAQPWGELCERPIPMFRNSGLREYVHTEMIEGLDVDTLACTLPYNAQVTPWFDITARNGDRIVMITDNYLSPPGDVLLRGEYISADGRQQYESLGWMNGHKLYYVIPKSVTVHKVMYRETGYDTDFEGGFECSDQFFNKLWEKSLRTLYITMRDNYMDCPDRERAQWTGDAVNESGEAFYSLSLTSHALARKWLYETVNWQKPDGTIFSPAPAGNWQKELAVQSLATVGYYGLWTYYLYTGDKQTIIDLYDGSRRYLDMWAMEDDGLVQARLTDWNWGDWGDNIDYLPTQNLWYYLAVKGMYSIAVELGKDDDASEYADFMRKFESGFNRKFWNGVCYRDPEYDGETDDRVQALAVISGVAGRDKYGELIRIFTTEEHASPYMEKYVFEAMMQMGYAGQALERHERRFGKMVRDERFTTLFEGWGIGSEGFGGGTVNHAWSGGGLTVLAQYMCGVEPLKPGWKLFSVMPQPGTIDWADITIPTVKGSVLSSFKNQESRFLLDITIPIGAEAVGGVPLEGIRSVYINGEHAWQEGTFLLPNIYPAYGSDSHIAFHLKDGSYSIEALK